LRIEAERQAEIGNGAVVVALVLVGQTAIVVGRGIPRIESQGPVEIDDGAIVLAVVDVGQAAIVVGDVIFWVESERLVGVCDSAIVLALIEVGEGAIVVGGGVFWVEIDRLVESEMLLSPRWMMRAQALMLLAEPAPVQSCQSAASSARAETLKAASAINRTMAKRMIASLGRSQIAHALKV
jgi:hypothetical protein